MPVYAYQCTSCGAATEVRQSFSDDALTVCETCGGALRKRFDAIGVTFKGSGFYRTDSRAAQTSSSGSKDSSPSTGAKQSSGSTSSASTTTSGSSTSS